MSNWCLTCGNTGRLADGSPCPDCSADGMFADNSTVLLTIPKQYQDSVFNSSVLDEELPTQYKLDMPKIRDSILSMEKLGINIFIGSPHKSGKTVWAYTIINALFRMSVNVFPLCDIQEVASIMKSVDEGRRSEVLFSLDPEATPDSIYAVPYLFVKVTDDLSYNVQDALTLLLDRRTRRGLSTIYLYSGTWDNFCNKAKRLKRLKGDGSFGTLKVYSYFTTVGGDEEC